MGKKINEYTVTASTIAEGSFLDVDQLISPSVWQSQKVPLSVAQVAFGVFYCADGQLKESRTVDLDGHTLQFLNGQTGFGKAPVLTPADVVGLTIDFNTGNYQTIDLQNRTVDLVLTLTNQLVGGIYTIEIIQGAGLVNVIWPAAVKWESGTPLIVTTIDDATDMVTMVFSNPNYNASFGSNFQ